ncbi:uncharacterized protein L3040_008237 [Drepanopeziza brunnea f. sp. 'multigermtubi']|uniref:MARVEL domain-containing protein n=1 Tax=Marssonina brunnea f. sp. multigermtubi (strain MB_m1) TaxID=1072389 RepID=K1WPU2_MARBU|nr:uncharacterized protein MBM_07632 [Drepanopeziza brunnea f. sp. 'multigermtubi' MB_m1]EKD14402.1 hypothetical protein MBM_07632 [Drepanopeziza brunnea f. sp. 'multigermtubi' MB_m1]KAJ5034970.1 hypothetical protein L3040_008237 [Drepanopeziza brunnea f. sp. 'multigermtubi']
MPVVRGVELAPSYIAHSVFRVVQMALALTVCGLYGVDLNRARQAGKYSDGKWVYAEVTGALAAATAVAYLIPLASRVPFAFVWDSVLFVLWIALFGLFGKMYLDEDPEGNADLRRMKHAVWVDLVNALLWLLSAVGMAVFWWTARSVVELGPRTRWTGRAKA